MPSSHYGNGAEICFKHSCQGVLRTCTTADGKKLMHPPALNLNGLNRDPEPALRKLQLGILSVTQLC